jgi:hypothetical protein
MNNKKPKVTREMIAAIKKQTGLDYSHLLEDFINEMELIEKIKKRKGVINDIVNDENFKNDN